MRHPPAASSRSANSATPAIPRPTLVLASRSDIDLDPQVMAPGATWLDYRLVERERMPLAMGGFGQEVRDALAARAEHLVADGLARRQGPNIVPQRDLLATLRRREVEAAGGRLSAETGLPYVPAAGGEMVAGTSESGISATASPASPRRAAGSIGVSGAGVGWRSDGLFQNGSPCSWELMIGLVCFGISLWLFTPIINGAGKKCCCHSPFAASPYPSRSPQRSR
jgi:hypothetical protein